MEVYRSFARVYDAFMASMPYERWANYIDKSLQLHGVKAGSLVLDLACGTGTMALLMAQKGYELIGIDASADMLSEAFNKMNEQEKVILFLNQTMQELELYGTVDAAYATCDSMNYLPTEDDFIAALKKVALYLNPGGIFIFDLKTESKYRQLGENTYHDSIKNASYIWRNHYDPATNINEYRVQFLFHNEEVFLEVHHQRAYSLDAALDMVKQSGLQLISVCDNYSDNPATDDSQRITFTVRKALQST